MRLLVVEDQRVFAEQLSSALLSSVSGITVEIRSSAASAIDAIQGEPFDFVLCDLQLPPTDGSGDLQIAHGRSVVGAVLVEASGTPVLVLSAFADKFDNLRDLVAKAGREDVLGTSTPYPMIDAEVKDRVDEAIGVVVRFAEELERLQDIDVQCLDGTILEPWEARVLRIFGRRSRGRVVQARRLGGGLSASRTFRIEVYNDLHDRRASVVAKLGTIDEVRDERERLQREIAPRLTEGTYAPYADAVTGGFGRYGGLFCKLLEGFDTPLAELLRVGDVKALSAIEELGRIASPWIVDAPWSTVKIGAIRSAQIGDPDLAPHKSKLAVMRTAAFEERPVNVRTCTQHEDLHGLNVLMNGDRPQLVDYARVGPSYAGTDPVSLELSLVFHPSMRLHGWPTIENAKAWADPRAFAAGSPYGDIIPAIRGWAQSASGSNRALCAISYSWALRQLKFPGVSSETALEIAASAIGAFET